MKVKVVTRILEANDRIAEENRKRFNAAGVYVVNLMGAPGAGKTTLLERTIQALKPHMKIGVIEGDIVGTDDAERIGALDVPVVQINTGGACHLDANMINEVLDELPLAELDLLMFKDGRRVGVEFKRSDAPQLTPSMRIALDDLGLDALYAVYPGDRRYALAPRVQAVPLASLLPEAQAKA
jgi:Ni2+-binding GTPase involved in maturation of urease and hydrogenase